MSRKNQVWISAIATCFMIIVMQYQGKPLKEKGYHIVAFELSKTPQRAQQIIAAWDTEGVGVARINTFIDFFFILAYASFGYFASLALTEKHDSAFIKKVGKVMARGMVIAALFDVVENGAMLQTLYGNMSDAFTQSAYWFALLKFAIIGLVLVMSILLLLKKEFGKLVANKTN